LREKYQLADKKNAASAVVARGGGDRVGRSGAQACAADERQGMLGGALEPQALV